MASRYSLKSTMPTTTNDDINDDANIDFALRKTPHINFDNLGMRMMSDPISH